MSHRTYPNADRALRQLDRHTVAMPPREPSDLELRLARQATLALTTMSAALKAMRRMAATGTPTPR